MLCLTQWRISCGSRNCIEQRRCFLLGNGEGPSLARQVEGSEPGRFGGRDGGEFVEEGAVKMAELKKGGGGGTDIRYIFVLNRYMCVCACVCVCAGRKEARAEPNIWDGDC